MAQKVLVLNQDYSALTICSMPKAFLLVYLNKAELVAESTTAKLHSVLKHFPILPSFDCNVMFIFRSKG